MSETDCFCLDINELIRVMGLNGTSDVLRQIISQNHNAIVYETDTTRRMNCNRLLRLILGCRGVRTIGVSVFRPNLVRNRVQHEYLHCLCLRKSAPTLKRYSSKL